MAFLKTPEEIARIQALIAEPRYGGLKSIVVPFRTRPEVIREVLPPGLSPTENPVATALVTHFGSSNYTGALEFATILVEARHGDLTGSYAAAMYVDTEPALIFGRELFGEPKKLASITMQREGGRVTAECSRLGSSILRIQAGVGDVQPVTAGQFILFNYKYQLKTGCREMEWAPVLMRFVFDTTITRLETGKGELTLRSGPGDRLGEFEVLETLGATHMEYDMRCRYETLGTVDPEAFLPHALSRIDDLSVFNTLGA
jgi:acetoacetate decarboxylase